MAFRGTRLFGRPTLGGSACLCLCLAGIVPAGDAHAGAWTRPAGKGIVIATAARRVAPVSSLTGGPVDEDANVSQIYLEYGLAEGLTAGGKLYVELSASNLEASSASLGGFLRKRLWQDGQGGVASVEGGYAHPVESLVGQGLELADPGAVPEAHIAGLYGRGWGSGWGNAFLSTGAAYHWRGDGLADEIRYEVTGGYTPRDRWMGLLSVYGLQPLGDGTDASLKVVPSVAYTFPPEETKEGETPAAPRTLQFGVSYDVLNRDNGLGVSFSVWQPF